MLNHKYRSRVINWLNKLTEEEYITKYWDKQLAAKPAVYSLSPKGREYLWWSDDKRLNDEEFVLPFLDRVWRDKKLSQQFREHCLLIADIHLDLMESAKEWKAKLQFNVKTDLYYKSHFIKPAPDAYIILEYDKKETAYYLLEIFDDIPPVAIRKRVKEYLEYWDDDKWQDHYEEPFPKIIFVCPSKRIKGHLYYKILKQRWGDEPIIYLTTKDAVKSQGLSGKILEKVEERD